jgi:type IV pilus assembly protein PilY1
MAEKIFNYIRGDASDEETDLGGIFRSRKWRINDPNHPLSGQTITSSKLGDLVHSSPVYNRGALYTGANDGMLHCFDAETGDEIFAYIPYPVFRNLKHLTDPGYDHKYYVDLTPTVANVDIDGMTHMLVGGLGKGGKGYYALDISNVDPTQNLIPNSEANVKSMVKWEFPNNQNGAKKTSNADRADLGYTFSKVTVAKSHDTANAPWVVIFGNGYLSENEKAVLFILDPRDGTVIRKIDTGIAGCNGMSTPMAVDVDYDGIVDYVYAGDLRGNMWKFDLTDSDYNNWDVAFYESGAPEPLFSTPGQPITTRPDIMKHCSKPGYLVFFGTGQYLEEDDLSDSSQQSLYAIWDYGDDADDTETAGVWDGSTLTTTDLLTGVTLEPQTITEHVFENKSYRVTSATIPDYSLARLASGGSGCGDYPGETTCDMDGTPSDPDPVADPLKRVGWVMNLPGSGERIVSDVVVRGGNLIVVSYIPEGSLCGTGGASWLMQLNACTGARLGSVLYDRDDDGDIDADDRITPSGGGDKVVPSGISFDGRLQPPAIIILDDGNEMLYLSSSNGTIQTQRQKSTPLGLVWWRIFEPNQ